MKEKDFSDSFFSLHSFTSHKTLLVKCRYSVQMLENMNQKNSKCKHFLRSKSDIRSGEKDFMLAKFLWTTVSVIISLEVLLIESIKY